MPGRPRSSDASGRAPTRGPAGSSHQTFPAGDARTYRANREEVDVDVRVRLLGGFEVVVDGVPVPADVWRRRGAAGLVKLLALAPRQRLHREQVIEALWPGEDPVTAGPRLHKAAHFARRGLGRADAVVLDGEVVHLFPDADVVVDATAFEARAVEALARGDPAEAALVAADVTGPLLPDDPYEVWADDVRERLRTLHLDLLRTAEAWADLAAAEPTDEQAHVRLAPLALEDDDPVTALRHLDRHERAARLVGLSPGPAALAVRRRTTAALHADAATDVDAPDLVGRGGEVQRVERLLTDVRLGHGQALFVSGRAGIGTSAILVHLERRAVARGFRVGTAVATRHEGAWPYASVLEAVTDLTRRHPEVLAELDPAVRAELDRATSGRDQDWEGGSSHQRLYVAVVQVLRRAAGDHGAVLVVDDVDEADASTLHLLHHLVRAAAGSPVLVVLGHRRDASEGLRRVRASLLSHDQATTLDLRPLDDDAARELVRRWVTDDAVVAALVAAGGGVPLELVERARAAARGESDPRTVLLGPDDDVLALLRRVAVLGTDVDVELATHMADEPEDRVWDLLDEAVARGLLTRSGAAVRFAHGSVRDLLLDQPPRALRDAHRRAAAALVARGDAAARVAHHLLAAGDRAEAAPWALTAASTDASLGAYQAALEMLDRVADVVRGADRGQLLTLRARLLHETGHPDALDAHRQALAEVDDPVVVRRLRTHLGNTAALRGDLATAQVALDGLAPDGRDARDDVELLIALGHLHLASGRQADAEADVEQARAIVAVRSVPAATDFNLITLEGLLAHHRGEWFDRLHVELLRGVERPGLAIGVFDSHVCVSEYLLYGPTPVAEVVELATSLATNARNAGSPRAEAFAVALRGEAALLSGDLGGAEADLSAAVALHRDIGAVAGEAHALERLAEVRLAEGDRTEARQLLDRALPLARWSPIPGCLLPRIYGTQVVAADDWWAARTRRGGRGRDGHGRRLPVLLDHVPPAGGAGARRRRRRRGRARAPGCGGALGPGVAQPRVGRGPAGGPRPSRGCGG